MATASVKLITAEELLAMQGDGRRELIDGILYEMPPAGGEHGKRALDAGVLLHGYAREHGGEAFGAETGFMLARDPDTMRAPDAAYIGPKRADEIGPTPGYLPGPPDLAVEVVSPNDTFSEVHEKALAWVAAGCGVVLVVDPSGRRVTRYRATDDVTAFAGNQPIDCAPAMPGLAPTAAQLLGDSA